MVAKRFTSLGLIVAVGMVMAVLRGDVVSASHAWGNYHWARTTGSFDLVVINSTTSAWDPYVTYAVDGVLGWSTSDKLDMVEETGSSSKKTRRQCKAPAGQVRICNLTYGQTGWLGVAGITVDAQGHILAGYTKLNDTYFNMSYYNKPDWKQSVTCQELGHNVGLGHQDEDFTNTALLSCMDYQDPPFEWPNPHDLDQLESLYGHTDSYDSYAGAAEEGGGTGGGGCNAPAGKGCNKAVPGNNGEIGWGQSLGRRGAHETFIRVDRDGTRHITDVRWVDEHEHHAEH